MEQKLFKVIFLLLIIISCKTNKNLIQEKKTFPQLKSNEIYWGNCMRYNAPFSDEVIINTTLGNNKSFYFDGPIYLKPNCSDIIVLKKNHQPVDGTYTIININEAWNTDSPYSIIAKFKNGKREGEWKYFRNEDFYSTKNSDVIKSLSGNKNYKLTILPIKIEVYKDGLPDGEWWQKIGEVKKYYLYKNGILINKRTEFISSNKS